MKNTTIFLVGFAYCIQAPLASADSNICDTSELAAALEEIFESDQGSRQGAAPVNDIWNRARLEQLVEQCGWPDAEVVGRKAAMGAFLVLQHAPLEMQVRYLPLLQQAEQKGQLVSGTLPYIEDRVLIRQGLPQMYGTQFKENCELHETLDPETVDERRKMANLSPLEEYAANCLERLSDQ